MGSTAGWPEPRQGEKGREYRARLNALQRAEVEAASPKCAAAEDPARDEQGLQAAIVELFHALGVFKRAIVFSVPNEGKRTKTTAGRLKAMGMLPGVTDLVLVHDGRAFFLEVKMPRGRLSPQQKEFEDLCRSRGACWALVRSVEEAKEQIQRWEI